MKGRYHGMSKYYYNSEMDEIESLDTIRSDYYDVFGNEYDTFEDYLSACMYYNNGVLTDVTDKLRDIKRELNRKLELARKYGYDEYEDEILALLERMDMFSRYARTAG